ncbi:MAG: hypothetical protein GY859_41935, partial [Desulfobacterales bacterium]|nr:hypothetical protein [Desulfobacterales bacterium]
ITGAEYHNGSASHHPVTAVYGSGCGQLAAVFDDFDTPKAVIGGTDIAMRPYLPSDILAFTVTKPMFKQLCRLDEKSFLHKSFWNNVKQARTAHQACERIDGMNRPAGVFFTLSQGGGSGPSHARVVSSTGSGASQTLAPVADAAGDSCDRGLDRAAVADLARFRGAAPSARPQAPLSSCPLSLLGSQDGGVERIRGRFSVDPSSASNAAPVSSLASGSSL